MTALPPAVFFINGNDISYPPTSSFVGATLDHIGSSVGPDTLTLLVNQLFIDDVMTKVEFDARMVADPNYAIIVHLRGLRILVVVPEYYDGYNRHLADVVMFYHQGLIDVEENRFGPPGRSFDAQRINMYELMRSAHDHGAVAVLPFYALNHCCECNYPFFCDKCHTFSGMKRCKCGCDCFCGCGTHLTDKQGIRQSTVHLPNCENEFHNKDFIHRK